MNNNSDIERWEDIPKAKISKARKQKEVTKSLKIESSNINTGWFNADNKSLRILNNLYINNINKVKNNQIRMPHKDLYGIVCDIEILRLAYRKLSKNKGAMTPGSIDITTKDIDNNFLEKLSYDLRMEKFSWSPARRIYVEKPGKKNKKKKKKRPLGINDFRNKIVQEAIRMILEAIYEPEFMHYETNSGFRPKRDCANAIEKIKTNAQFANIAIEGDIVGAFDAINHDKLFNIIKRRIRDNKLLKLIYSSFKAGIIEERTYIDTNLGVPQGGICSPILFNIYMHEFDIFITDNLPKIIESEDPNSHKNQTIRENSEYKKLRNRRKKCEDDIKSESNKPNIIDKDINTLFSTIRNNRDLFKEDIWDDIMSRGKEFDKRIYKNTKPNALVNVIKQEIVSNSNLIQVNTLLNYKINKLSEEIKIINLKLKSTPHGSIENSKILMFYHRYADDWTLWLRSTEDFAKKIKNTLKNFLKDELEMELSEEKTKITILTEDQVKFLSFSIYRNKNVRLKNLKFNEDNNQRKITTRINNLRIDVDRNRINERFETNGFFEIVKYYDNKKILKPREIGWLTVFEVQQIIEKFNQFMLGFGNYYITVISEPSRINKYLYILYYSCLKTLSCKLKMSIKKLTEEYGYYDISVNKDFNNSLSQSEMDKYLHTDIRICYKYKFNNTEKWITLLNYKELMYKLLEYRKKFQENYNKKCTFLTPNIDYYSMYKMNFRTRFKMTSHCTICGSTQGPLHNHHIKKLSHTGNKKLKGYKNFDKLVASLNRLQITICQICHDNIHKGLYNGLKLTDLYDVRSALPENFIKTEDEIKESSNKTETIVKDNLIVINEEKRTYWNRNYSEYIKKNNKYK